MSPFLKRLKSKLYFYFTCRTSIKGTNNKILYASAFPKGVSFCIMGNNNTIEIGEGTKLYGVKITMIGDGHSLKLGKKCIIKMGKFHFKNSDCEIIIGEHTSTEGVDIIINEPGSRISVGDDCMFSHDIHIRNGDSHSIIDQKSKRRVNFSKNIVIGDHVWVGAYAKILKGSVCKSDSIIGLGSIVSGEVESNTIVAGVPARLVKTGITWTRKRYYDDNPIQDELLWQEKNNHE